MPSIRAPSETRKRQRSWTCGSQAAWPSTVSPSASTAAMIAFSVPITDASSRKIGVPRGRGVAHLVGAVDLDLDAELREARGCACRAGDGRSRRRPGAARSRGRSARAAGRRAGTRRGSGGRAPGRARSCARRSGRPGPRSAPIHSASAPMSASSSTIVSTSRIRGTFVSRTGSDGEHGRGEDRQRAVLVPGRADGAAERAPALDHEGLHLGGERSQVLR